MTCHVVRMFNLSDTYCNADAAKIRRTLYVEVHLKLRLLDTPAPLRHLLAIRPTVHIERE